MRGGTVTRARPYAPKGFSLVSWHQLAVDLAPAASDDDLDDGADP